MKTGGSPVLKRLTAFALLLMLLVTPLTSFAAKFTPSRAVAYMESKFTCGCTRGGSGAMIGRRGLVTAAHNLYCPYHAKPLQYCNFYFGAKSANSCWYQYSGNFTYRVYDTFANGYSSVNDIGYVIFDSAVGDQTGWFGWMTGYDSDLDEEFMNLLNYDSRRHLQNVFEVMYVLSDKQLTWYSWISGTDGGPVYYSDDCYVVAVFTSHDDNGNGYGRRLTSDVISDMTAEGAFR